MLVSRDKDNTLKTSIAYSKVTSEAPVWIKLYIQIPTGKRENLLKYLGISSNQVGYFPDTNIFWASQVSLKILILAGPFKR